jgi:LacI family transcriptional regulator
MMIGHILGEIDFMPSLRKLAQLAGLSASTVSRALRDDPRLKPETVARVKALAELYHYRPNRLVQTLVSGKSHAIGCIVPRIDAQFFAGVVRGVLEHAFSESYHVITLQSESNLTYTCKALQTLIELQVDGVLLSSGNSVALPDAALFEAWSHGVVLVGIQDSPTVTPIDQVLTDEDQVAELMVGHLHALGHRDIAYVGTNLELISRGKAVKRALRRRRLSTEWFYDTEKEQIEILVATWRAQTHAPTAVTTYTDIEACMVLQAATRLGLQVPRDLSVVGCANMEPLINFLPHPLTSIEHYPSRIGHEACALLLERINESAKPGSYTPIRRIIATSLVKRASCGPPRRGRL